MKHGFDTAQVGGTCGTADVQGRYVNANVDKCQWRSTHLTTVTAALYETRIRCNREATEGKSMINHYTYSLATTSPVDRLVHILALVCH